MNEQDLHNIVNKCPWIKYHFDGTFGCDDVRPIKKNHHFIIVNTRSRKKQEEEEEEEGKRAPAHWVCFFKIGTAELECFDSLGSKDRTQAILAQNYKFLKGYSSTKFSLEQYQSSDSDTCGRFCIYFANQRLRHLYDSFEDVLANIFSADTQKNEELVNNFVAENHRKFEVKQEAIRKTGLPR